MKWHPTFETTNKYSMNQSRARTAVSLVVALFVLLSVARLPDAHAACASLPTTNGTVTNSITVPMATTYSVWARIMLTATTDNFYVRIDDNSGNNVLCNVNMGNSSSVPANAWKWVNFTGTPSALVTANLVPGTQYTLSMAGDANVKIDRVILTGDSSCQPDNTVDETIGGVNYIGSNCADSVAPDTTITNQPASSTTNTSASFSFTGSDNVTSPGSLTFKCKLDSAAFATCTSPQSYTNLTVSSHTFSVEAIDGSGNIDPSPASYTWTITSATTTNDTLNKNQALAPGDSLSSSNGYRLTLQTDGNLVLYNGSNKALWYTGTTSGSRLALQSDGNLVLYNKTNQPLWYTGTNAGSRLVVQSDGNLVLYNASNVPLWNSDTAGGVAVSDTLTSGSTLVAGSSLDAKMNGYRLIMQSDGNLVIYAAGHAIWYTGTSGANSRLTLQTDGNLVLYNSSNRPLWYSGTSGATRLVMQSDGNLVLYNANNVPLWNSSTSGKH